jgi:hypothetical protein
MDPVLLTTVAGLLTIGAGLVAASYKTQYGSAIKVMGEVGQFVGAISDVVVEIQKVLADEKVTPEEVKEVSERLAKFKPLLDEIQHMLAK